MPDSPDPLELPMSKLIYTSINALHIDIQKSTKTCVCMSVADGTKVVHAI